PTARLAAAMTIRGRAAQAPKVAHAHRIATRQPAMHRSAALANAVRRPTARLAAAMTIRGRAAQAPKVAHAHR
ncbi:hypothetical protein, partial [Burkholderia sp. SIMBA_019]|uniref:hypothetical protein n=1 Tax=Burkholderia sp. SIMBA_019 TaxID=3085765 RepID=UPI00397CA5DE